MMVRLGYGALIGGLVGCALHAPPMGILAALVAWSWWRAFRRGEA